ncbi:exodeoxyribonuclease V subunit beta [Segetibacter aerophilus]|uniref:RecBCD enzyme subunit RecB n=1 Tax=Segetibacter aerophilus TaxID=670293 RepID=A0A512BG65_9BACT|nr:exodeoxyribonuclease V subunit beta [Segetibacter aerophilus]GEO10951.1 RecBCD enzyme subunit RecB [Segetibacter aerophilus]
MKVKDFDTSTVPLSGSNLIEASAGTGKTYSIAIMVLRLVLENKIPIKEVLMVTFTKAAVAELEERIRLFIRQAHKASLGNKSGDPTLSALVEHATKLTSQQDVQQRLKDAVLFLDETSVLTIHSFCQQTLTEFAFETNQLFGSETLKDLVSLIESEVNKFWRENITTLNVDLLGQLLEHGLSRADLVSVIREHLSGKNYFEYDENESYLICDEDQVSFSNTIKELAEKDLEIKDCVYDHIRNHSDRLKSITEANKWAKASLLHLVDTPPEFLTVVVSKKGTGYIDKLYGDIILQHSECDDLVEERKSILQSVINKINCHAIGIVTKAIDQYKQRNSLLGFDDMIVNLHKAIVHNNNTNLITSLQRKYRAIFIDEFQDTDKLQYEIFHNTFGTGQNILFYIGDPKQSIYSWRKADIFTYFKASDEVDNKYGMNVNYRSSASFINAMNLFFKPRIDFDTFYFNGHQHSIDYIKVESPRDNNKGGLYLNGQQDVPITIYGNQNNSEIAETVTAQIINLLEKEKFTIVEKGISRRIRPSDIGILVRKNKQAIAVKACLAKRGIPAVTIDDTKILQSEEAIYVLYLLEALIDLNRPSINKALLSPFTGYDTRAVLALNEETVLNNFREYKSIWDKDGVYSVLMKFVSDYQVRALLLNHHTENGERTIANLYQIIEVLHKVQSAKQFSELELVSWLKRGIDGMQTEGDEFEQRVESDEEAVKIVTLHKSKGLEYNIVFAPFLDLDTKIHFRFCSFRDTETGDYIFADSEQLNPEQQQIVDEQTEQENRRLIYVAITRAVYKCYLNKSLANYYKDSSLVPFLASVKGIDPSLISFNESPTIPAKYYYSFDREVIKTAEAKPVNFTLSQVNWRKMSYTSLASAHTTSTKHNSGIAANEYDHFVFKQLVKGNKTGNLLHYIFENIDFANNRNWERTIQSALKRYTARHSDYTTMLIEMLNKVTKVSIKMNGEEFSLSNILQEKRLNELEFDFNVGLFDPADLAGLTNNDTRINLKYSQDLEGVMNGKMDMFFEYNNKYYILDWKSNFLGDSVEYYKKELLPEVMSENNYHLQYLLYTLAAKKYLQSRLPEFDYERHFGGVIYLFVRGIRDDANSGVFTSLPSLRSIEMLEKILSKKISI